MQWHALARPKAHFVALLPHQVEQHKDFPVDGLVLGIATDSNAADHFLEFNKLQVLILIHHSWLILDCHLGEDETLMNQPLVECHPAGSPKSIEVDFGCEARAPALERITSASKCFHKFVDLEKPLVIIKQQLVQPL